MNKLYFLFVALLVGCSCRLQFSVKSEPILSKEKSVVKGKSGWYLQTKDGWKSVTEKEYNNTNID